MKGYSSKCTAFFVERHAVLSTQPSYVPIVHCGVGKHYIRPVGQFSKKIASFVGGLDRVRTLSCGLDRVRTLSHGLVRVRTLSGGLNRVRTLSHGLVRVRTLSRGLDRVRSKG